MKIFKLSLSLLFALFIFSQIFLSESISGENKNGKNISLIEESPLGDKYFEMNIFANTVLKDIEGMTKGFGIIVSPWVPTLFSNAYLNEVGASGITLRINHDIRQIGNSFPSTQIHKAFLNAGAIPMVAIIGTASDNAYCQPEGWQGETCVDFELSSIPKDLLVYKERVKQIVRFYNQIGIFYFILWNEPNYVYGPNGEGNLRPVCRAPNDCWWPTLEDFIDLTLTMAEAIQEVNLEDNVNNTIGVDATSSFFGTLPDRNGISQDIPPAVFEALRQRGIEAYHHYHYYNPNPYNDNHQAIENFITQMNATNPFFLGTNADEGSDGIINGDGINQVAYVLAKLADNVNLPLNRMGYFQLYSPVHEPGTINCGLIECTENMISQAGIFRPIFWLSSLLHSTAGTLLLDDDLNESDTVRAFAVRNAEGNAYRLYAVNFDESGQSATIGITVNDLPKNVRSWKYTTYTIDAQNGNPALIESEIEGALNPMIQSVKAEGGSHLDYLNAAWPTLEDLNHRSEAMPTVQEKIISGGKTRLSTQITIPYKGIKVICLEENSNRKETSNRD